MLNYDEINALIKLAVEPVMAAEFPHQQYEIVPVPPQVTSRMRYFHIRITKHPKLDYTKGSFFNVVFGVKDDRFNGGLAATFAYLQKITDEIKKDVASALANKPFSGADTWPIPEKWFEI